MTNGAHSDSSWQGAAYATASGHHRAADDWFLAHHPPKSTDHIVDLGSGAGEFTARLADLVPQGHVTGVEPDVSMLAAARAHVRPNLEFVQGSAQELERIIAPSSVDLVVSRAVFHWIPLAAYPRCYAAIHRVLHPGGWFHAESGGAGTVSRVMGVLDDIARDHGLAPARLTFPDAGTAFDLLERAGFEIPTDGVRTVAQRRTFDAEQLRRVLWTQFLRAYVAGEPETVRDRFWASVQACIDKLRHQDGTYDQILVRLHVLVRRPA